MNIIIVLHTFSCFILLLVSMPLCSHIPVFKLRFKSFRYLFFCRKVITQINVLALVCSPVMRPSDVPNAVYLWTGLLPTQCGYCSASTSSRSFSKRQYSHLCNQNQMPCIKAVWPGRLLIWLYKLYLSFLYFFHISNLWKCLSHSFCFGF